jgi:hypothetical protein
MRIALAILASIVLTAPVGAGFHLPKTQVAPAVLGRDAGAAQRSPACDQPLFDRIFARTAAATPCSGQMPAVARRRIG